jgi:hypothetical protein
MKQGGGAHEIATSLEGHAAGGLDVLEVVDRGEMPIHQNGIGEPPQMFRGLEFGRIRRQEEQMHMVGDAEALGAMPARAIEDEHNLLGRTRADRLGEGGEFGFEDVLCASPSDQGCLGSHR